MTDYAPRGKLTTPVSVSLGAAQHNGRLVRLRRPNRQLSLYDDETSTIDGELQQHERHRHQSFRQQVLNIVGNTVAEDETGPVVASPIGRIRMMREHQQQSPTTTKITQMVNPDGSTTVRNMVLHRDGKGSKIVLERPFYPDVTNINVQQKQDQHQQDVTERGAPADSSVITDYYEDEEDEDDRYYFESRGRKLGAVVGHDSPKGVLTTTSTAFSSPKMCSPFLAEVPGLAPANSFESSTSSSTMKTAKSRSDGSEDVSEGTAHELRRRRLAKSKLALTRLPVVKRKQQMMDSSSDHQSSLTTPPRSPPKTASLAVGSTPSPSTVRSISSTSEQMMTYIPANLTSPPRPIRTTHSLPPAGPPSGHQHVVGFTGGAYTDDDVGETSFITEDDATADAGDSLGYPAFDGSTHYSIATTTDNSSLFDNLGGLPETGQQLQYSPSTSLQCQVEQLRSTSSEYDSSLLVGGDASHDIAENLEEILGPPPVTTNRSQSRLLAESLFIAQESDLDESEGVDEDEIPYMHVVTVHKTTIDDKIGVFVGLKHMPQYGGIRLVVSKISPDGKFANRGVNVGDVVVSINGKSFVENPKSQDAFGKIVRFAVVFLFDAVLQVN
jgi:hypothetical protein